MRKKNYKIVVFFFYVSLLKIKSTQDRGTVELQETNNKNEASNQYRLRDKAADSSCEKAAAAARNVDASFRIESGGCQP